MDKSMLENINYRLIEDNIRLLINKRLHESFSCIVIYFKTIIETF